MGGSIVLGRLRTGESVYRLERPKGAHHCRLIVVCAKPDADRLRAALTGRLAVKRNGQSIFEQPLCPETLRQCHWLRDKYKGAFVAYFLHDEAMLDQGFTAKGEYTVEIVLSGQPPPDSTLWLFYLPWHLLGCF
jgi:hypothetical protein